MANLPFEVRTGYILLSAIDVGNANAIVGTCVVVDVVVIVTVFTQLKLPICRRAERDSFRLLSQLHHRYHLRLSHLN